MSPSFRRWSTRTPSERLRAIGALVLVLGLAGSSAYYWIRTRSAGPTINDLMPGYERARERTAGIMMGSLGITLIEWLDALQEPRTQAIIIAGAAALAALICFRIAWLMDAPGEDENLGPGPRY